ncbi:MAG: hypothetical protein A2Y22_03060 [Clostridiales bacterium GWD2_32_59]|nr:MAG: hypothetical protein A2Y22_03060 [Clostridiales bacterium GWD2_32_59]
MIVGGVQKEIDPGKGTCPLISNNRTLVPIRAIVEELGGSVAWNNADQKISVLLGTKAIELWIGNKTTNVNGIEKMTDVAPQIINERTMVPLRYVIDNLGFNVSWDEVSKKVTITH